MPSSGKEDGELSGNDVLPGFRCAVRLFRWTVALGTHTRPGSLSIQRRYGSRGDWLRQFEPVSGSRPVSAIVAAASEDARKSMSLCAPSGFSASVVIPVEKVVTRWYSSGIGPT